MKNRLTVREIVLFALWGAIMFASQIVLAPVPNVELVSLFVILFTLHYQRKALWIIYVFVLAEGLAYGFGLWLLNYCYVWFVLWAIVLGFEKHFGAKLEANAHRILAYSLISCVFGLCFGLLCALPYILIEGFPADLGYFLSGIPYDFIHGTGNLAVCLMLFYPLDRVLNLLVCQFTYSNAPHRSGRKPEKDHAQ